MIISGQRLRQIIREGIEADSVRSSILPRGVGVQEFVEAFRSVFGDRVQGDKAAGVEFSIPDRDTRISELVEAGVGEVEAGELFDLAVACVGPGKTYPADFLTVGDLINSALDYRLSDSDIDGISGAAVAGANPDALKEIGMLFHLTLAPRFVPFMRMFGRGRGITEMLSDFRSGGFEDLARSRDFMQRMFLFAQPKEIDEDYMPSLLRLLRSGNPVDLEQAAVIYDSL